MSSTKNETAKSGCHGEFGTASKDRAFVLQLAADCAADAADFKGRLQHLPTADGGNFESLDGLFAIIRRVLSHRERAEEDS